MKKNDSTALGAIYALSQAITGAAEPSQVYELILDEVVRSLGVQKASIMTFDPEQGVLKIAAARGMDPKIMNRAVVRVGEGISGKVFQSNEPLLIKDIQAEGVSSGRERYHTTSLMSAPVTCFPMKVGKEVLGVINVTDRTDGKPFGEGDLRLLTTFTNQAAAYLHIIKLSEIQAENERIRQQLEIARQIQYKLLPSDPPHVEGLDIAGRLITAERVGGDYYDVFFTDAKKPSFVVADVSGHSIGAALIMAAFRSAIRSQKDADYSPSILSQRINSILYDDLFQSEQFISMTYLQYLKSRQTVQYTAAGHPPPLIWRAVDGKFEEIGTGDPLLGIEQRGVFHEKQMVVSKGDVIVMYTDGIVEALAGGSRADRFGRDRMVECLKDAVVGSARQIVDVLVESVQAFADPDPLRDDITALVLKVL
jgi:sigma-B regulation protein RsbU (phosphoserine phosphatase)